VRPILALARAELLHIVRDRATLAQVLVMPLLQLLVLSNAATFAVRDSPMWVADFDRTPASRGAISRLAASGFFRVVGDAASLDAANDALLDGRITLALVVPHGFEKSLTVAGRADVELSVNAEKGSAAGVVQAYATTVLARYAQELSAPSGAPPRIDIRERSRFNAALDYRIYMVPGILVALVTLIGTLLAAQNVAREKEIGTLEQINVTPITRGQFIVGKLVPLWGLGLLDLAIGLVVGVTLFHVPVLGSVPLLFLVASVYLLVALGIGLWISTVVETQQQAMFVAFFLMNVYLLMSGLLTPIDSMAPWVQTFSQINPVRHFVTIARAILLKGAGLADVIRPLVILMLYAAAVLTFAVRQYRKQSA
jgi:ABC-type multidrug transport system permease subunit